jgi:hypothetical protein
MITRARHADDMHILVGVDGTYGCCLLITTSTCCRMTQAFLLTYGTPLHAYRCHPPRISA